MPCRRGGGGGGGGPHSAQIFTIFQNVQHNVVQHKKYVKELSKIYKKLDEDTFREAFSRALHYLFTFGEASPNVDKVVQFVATFCTSLGEEDEFLLVIFEIIFNCQCVSAQSVRYRASQLLAAILAALGDDASLDDELCDKLLNSQKERLQDTRGAVRCRAALALQRLQIPTDPDDVVTRAYRFHMSCDPSSSVRRAIVTTIAKSTRNLPYVLERLCDVDDAVRRAAFIHISGINVTQLKVRQRVHTLKVGLMERNPRIKRVVEEILLPNWLSTFKGNIVELLTAVRLDNVKGAKDSQYVAGKLLESCFKRLDISELLEWLPLDKTLRVIPADKLSKETVCYWRHLAEHLLKLDDDETLERVVPDLVVLTGYIRAIVQSPCPSEKEDPVGFGTRQYVLHELACLVRVYDTSDQVGRTALQQLLFDVLTGDHGPMNEEVIAAFVSAVELVLPEVTSRVEFIGSIITELREPGEQETPAEPEPPQDCTEAKLQRARLRVSLNVAMEAQEEAVRDQNYALAAECKAKVERLQKQLEEFNIQPSPPPPPAPVVREKSNDPAVLNKCLQILNMVMDTPQITNITPLLKLIFSELEVEIFQNPGILESALKTVALYGMLDAEFAKEHKAFFFSNLMDLDNERLSCTVLNCVIDLMCVHGARLFEEEPAQDAEKSRRKNGTLDDASRATTMLDVDESDVTMFSSLSHGTVIELLLKIMDSPCDKYRLIVVEGLCRLLMLSHLESPGILSRLLLLWFNPATEDEDLLRQTIGVFFQSFATSVDGAQEQIQNATLPTLKALANAPLNSPLAEIDQESIVKFIISLTRVQHEMSDSQGSMAMLLTSNLVEELPGPATGLLCRCLALLQPPRDPSLCTDLARTLRNILHDIPDKTSARNITRYLGSLEASERAATNKVSTMGTINETNEVTEDNVTACIGRATSSMPAHPMARSTHIPLVNGTVEEEVDIDETSPTDPDQSDKRNSGIGNSDFDKLISDTAKRNSEKDKRNSDNDKLNSDIDKRNSDNEKRNSDNEKRNSDTDKRKSDTEKQHSDNDKRSSDERNSEKSKRIKNKQTTEERHNSDSSLRVNALRGSHIPEYDSPQPGLSSEGEADREGMEERKESKESDSSSSPSPQKRPRVANKGCKRLPTKIPTGISAEPAKGKKQTDKQVDEPTDKTAKGSIDDVNTASSTPATPVRKPTKNKKQINTPKTTKSARILETPSSELRRSGRTLKSTASSESTSSGKSSSSGKPKGSSGKSSNTAAKPKKPQKSVKSPVTSRRTRPSAGSGSPDLMDDSADETELHTIIYDRGFTTEERHNSDSSLRVNAQHGLDIPEYDSPQPGLSSEGEADREGMEERKESKESDSSSSPSPQKRPRVANKGRKRLPTKIPTGISAEPTKGKKQTDKQVDEPTDKTAKGSIDDVNRASSTPATPVRKPTKNKKQIDTPKTTKSARILETPSSELRRSGRTLKSTTSSESTSSGKSSSSGKPKGSSGKSSKAAAKPKKPQKFVKSPVTSRRTRPSAGSGSPDLMDDSADETELHTIIYDRGFEQSLMPDSSDDEAGRSKAHVTIPETPDASDNSE